MLTKFKNPDSDILPTDFIPSTNLHPGLEYVLAGDDYELASGAVISQILAGMQGVEGQYFSVQKAKRLLVELRENIIDGNGYKFAILFLQQIIGDTSNLGRSVADSEHIVDHSISEERITTAYAMAIQIGKQLSQNPSEFLPDIEFFPTTEEL